MDVANSYSASEVLEICRVDDTCVKIRDSISFCRRESRGFRNTLECSELANKIK